MNVIFFRCTHCGEHFYTQFRINYKKCNRCHRSFKFTDAIKKTYELQSILQAPEIIKKLKLEDIKK